MSLRKNLPNRDVTYALFDSYVTSRIDTWELEFENNKIKKPKDPKAAHKLEVTKDILKKAKSANSLNDWLDIVDYIYPNEKNELADSKNHWALTKVFFFWALDIPMLHLTLQAVRSYIISQVKDDPAFADKLKAIKDKLVELDKQILFDQKHIDDEANKSKHTEISKRIEANQAEYAEKTSKLKSYTDIKKNEKSGFYHEDYFKDIIMERDHRKLSEKSFQDFISNINNKRQLTNSTMLLSEDDKMLQADTAKQAAAASSTLSTTAKVMPAISAPLAVSTPDSNTYTRVPVTSSPLLENSAYANIVTAEKAAPKKPHREPVMPTSYELRRRH